MLKNFGASGLITLISALIVLFTLGPAAAATTVVLIAIEIAFSIDNAVLNAKVLDRLSHFWQHLFLTVGVVIAIVGMRFVFPVLIVSITANLPWREVINEALHQPSVYAAHLHEAHTAIAAFGGSFLLTLTLYFLFDDARQELWLERLEAKLQQIGGNIWLPPLLAFLVLSLVAYFAGDKAMEIWRAGLAGIISYTALKLLIDGLGRLAPSQHKTYSGWPAFLAFCYLQLLDASFSFDSVLGAFAITDQVILIVVGLGVGALWVRSLTVYMVRRGLLKTYIYLEHGAHYAILVLSLALLGSLYFEVPDAVTGIAGLGVIWASFESSREAIRAKQD